MHDLSRVGSTWAAATATELTEYFGREVTLSASETSEVDPSSAPEATGTVVQTACTVAGDEGGELAVVASLESAREIATWQIGEALWEPPDAELSGRSLEAYRCVVELCVGVLGRVLEEEAGLPSLSLGESRTLALPEKGDDALRSGGYRKAGFTIAVAGGGACEIDLLIPADLAGTWFGPPRSDPAEGSGDERVAIIDPALADSDGVDALSEALGHAVESFDPMDLSPEALESLGGCCGLILSWNPGGVSGLDILEMLLRDPRTASLEIAMASEAPTPVMVSAALRWGAGTFLFKPYDAEEIRARLIARSIGAPAADDRE